MIGTSTDGLLIMFNLFVRSCYLFNMLFGYNTSVGL